MMNKTKMIDYDGKQNEEPQYDFGSSSREAITALRKSSNSVAGIDSNVAYASHIHIQNRHTYTTY